MALRAGWHHGEADATRLSRSITSSTTFVVVNDESLDGSGEP